MGDTSLNFSIMKYKMPLSKKYYNLPLPKLTILISTDAEKHTEKAVANAWT